MPLIIDGYNLLRTIQKTSDEYESIDEFQLCMLVDKYIKLVKDGGEIIFDGFGPQDKSVFNSVGRLDIFFAGGGKDADTVIENRIKANTAPKRLRVISSDRRLKKAALARKAIAIKSEVFWGNMQSVLEKKRLPKEPAEKHRGLSEIETDKWLEFFDIDQ